MDVGGGGGGGGAGGGGAGARGILCQLVLGNGLGERSVGGHWEG